ncbi:hypothetical protein N7519_008641 [Penicillium mononematosum]|uniref:uncharacterized protein n=1 Tax=Penicillium mononematosum TaxID=268346 RepID=UPI002548792F|nr:uncharacterized protein N7519_008641 [Penicillium mononematosum]KAJ6178180.1 hypothetical protein N7519_008641 [Penicillium mononematosum]
MPAVGRLHGSSFRPSQCKKQSLLHLQETISYSVVDSRAMATAGEPPWLLVVPEYSNLPQEVVNNSVEENISREVITEATKYPGVIDCQFAAGGLDPSHLSSGFFRGSTVVGIAAQHLDRLALGRTQRNGRRRGRLSRVEVVKGSGS